MAENGILEGILGGVEGEEREAEETGFRAEAAATAVATSVAIDGARFDPELSRAASDYLNEQRVLVRASTELVRIQAHHSDEERQLSIEAAKRKRFSDHFRMSFQVFMTLVATVICVGVGVMVWDAATSKSVVLDSFDSPAPLVAQGLTGKVMASRVLDALEELQDATRAVNGGWTSTNAWSSDVKIELPETGISIGEINHILHERLGHDIHINGDADLAKDGTVTLFVRGEGVPASHFSAPLEDFDKLAVRAAEYIYGRSQATRYATYLINTNRNADATQFLPGAMVRAKPAEAPELATLWGNALATQGKLEEAEQKYRLALLLEPHLWRAWGNLVGLKIYTEGEEAAHRESQAMLKSATALGVKVDNTVEFQNSSILSRDFGMLIKEYTANIEQNHGVGTAVSPSGPSMADFYGNLHDFPTADKWLVKSDPEEEATRAEVLLLSAYRAIDRGQPAAALPALQTFWTLWSGSAELQNDMYTDQSCITGLAYGMAGELAKAEEVFSHTKPWAYCYAVHGDVLEHAGKLAEAQKVWADGLKAAPSLAPVYLHRGISESLRGDYKQAEADLAAASARSPHWADPYKAWGDALVKQGRWKEALLKYDAAAEYAPNWPALVTARAAAKSKAG